VIAPRRYSKQCGGNEADGGSDRLVERRRFAPWRGCQADPASRALHGTCIPVNIRINTRDAPMANVEHVALLKKSVAAWNAWRRNNPDMQPDLCGASLAWSLLIGADLRKAKLSKADLRGAKRGSPPMGEPQRFEPQQGDPLRREP
jgi:Pentapeptide repeats (8 copies)